MHYYVAARLIPSLLIFMPMLQLLSVTNRVIFIYMVFSYIYSLQINRFGVSLQKKIWHEGNPTTLLILRGERADLVDQRTVNRYKKSLERSLGTVESSVYRYNDDSTHYAAIKYLISKCRDHNKYAFLFQKNIAYGKIRNITASLPLMYIISVISALILREYCKDTKALAVVCGINILYVTMIGVLFNKKAVRIADEEYACALLENS